MAVFDSPITSYSDTTPQKRVITDVISIISPSDAPLVEALGGLDGAASKFRFVNGQHTAVEWLEDELFPLTDQLNGSIASNTTAVTVDDASKFSPGDIIAFATTQADFAYVTAVDTATEIITVSRNYNSAQASQADDAAVTIVSQARLEGDDSDARAFSDRTTGSNYTQIFQHEVKVSRTQNQLSQYGIANELEYQAMKAIPGLMRLVEKAVFQGVRKAGSATTPRAMGGLGTFITDNTVSAGGALVQADFEDAAEAAYGDGGTGPWLSPTAPANLQVIKNLYDSSNFLRVNRNEATIGMNVADIVTPFGDVNLLLDRWAPASKQYLIDPNHAGLLTYYPFTREPLAKTGDFEREEVVGEYTLCVRQDKAHAVITSIS